MKMNSDEMLRFMEGLKSEWSTIDEIRKQFKSFEAFAAFRMQEERERREGEKE